MMLSFDTAYRSFGGEVEASSTPTICRLPDSRRHQLSAIALTRMLPPLHNEGLRTKRGKPADKSYLYKLLSNRVYLGDAVHKGATYPGEHKAIIDRKLWDRVHALLQE